MTRTSTLRLHAIIAKGRAIEAKREATLTKVMEILKYHGIVHAEPYLSPCGCIRFQPTVRFVPELCPVNAKADPTHHFSQARAI